MEIVTDEEIIKVETEGTDSSSSIKFEMFTSDFKEETYSTADLHYDIDIKLENDTDYQLQNDALDDECREIIASQSCEGLTSNDTVEESIKLERNTSNQSEGDCLSPTNTGNKILNKRKNYSKCSFQCKYCSYSTPFANTLDRHIYSWHEIGEIYNCELCEYITSRADALTNHFQSKHSQEKLYKCEKCDYASGHSGSLRAHIRNQHMDKKNRRKEMKTTNHPLQNINVGPAQKINFPLYKCKRCEYKTLHFNHFHHHLKNSHSQKVLRCKECDFESSKVATMKWHCYVKHVKQSAGSLLLKCEHCKFMSKDLESMKCHLKFCQKKY